MYLQHPETNFLKSLILVRKTGQKSIAGKCSIDSKTRIFQYKIVNHALYLNKCLFQNRKILYLQHPETKFLKSLILVRKTGQKSIAGKCSIDSKTRIFQYKIVNHALYLNKCLFQNRKILYLQHPETNFLKSLILVRKTGQKSIAGKCSIDSKTRIFQCKIVNHALYLNKRLFQNRKILYLQHPETNFLKNLILVRKTGQNLLQENVA